MDPSPLARLGVMLATGGFIAAIHIIALLRDERRIKRQLKAFSVTERLPPDWEPFKALRTIEVEEK